MSLSTDARPALSVRTLLVRGMLAGVAAGVVAFAFASLFGEGPIDQAIAFETAHADPADAHAPEVVSRIVQKTVGLATAVGVYAVAVGGLFALAFALAYGRLGALSARATAVALGFAGFVTVALVPFLKYPANPPATGDPDTLQQRTVLFFLTIVISVAAGVGAVNLGRWLAPRLGGWNGTLVAAAAYVVLVGAALAILPSHREIPDGFPAAVLWDFRLASLGTQLAAWATLGLVFGALTERALRSAR